MIFSSSIFLLIFLPIFLLVYVLTPKRFKNYIILIASVLFYSWGAPKFIFVILGSTIIDYFLVNQLYKSTYQKSKRVLLATSITLNLGLLLYFKYANFFIDNLNGALSTFGFENIAWTSIALPIGISFYTFQTLTYSIDVYRGLHKPLDRLTDYLLYILSFPQMIAGPIVRFTSIADQIENRKDIIDDKLIGFYRFCIGLAKKVLIANLMAQQADAIFNSDYSELTSSMAWIGMIAYTFQIYFDFSGYSDMAIGLGRMMGFKFPENFDSPYVSKSISEFWRRWHITLGDFMRNYLYIPLGGNRVETKSRLYFNLWFVFLLSGLWHGASWNYVLWGAFHGFFLILERLFLKNVLLKMGTLLSTVLTFIIVMLGWVVFRIEETEMILPYLSKVFSFDAISNFTTVTSFWFILVIALFFSFFNAFSFGKKTENFIFRKDDYSIIEHLVLAVISIVFFWLSLSFITSSGFNPFIYFRF